MHWQFADFDLFHERVPYTGNAGASSQSDKYDPERAFQPNISMFWQSAPNKFPAMIWHQWDHAFWLSKIGFSRDENGR